MIYCVKCKSKTDSDNKQDFVCSNGRVMIKCICRVCRSRKCQFTKSKKLSMDDFDSESSDDFDDSDNSELDEKIEKIGFGIVSI